MEREILKILMTFCCYGSYSVVVHLFRVLRYWKLEV